MAKLNNGYKHSDAKTEGSRCLCEGDACNHKYANTCYLEECACCKQSAGGYPRVLDVPEWGIAFTVNTPEEERQARIFLYDGENDDR